MSNLNLNPYHTDDTDPAIKIIGIVVAIIVCFGFVMCTNSMADAELKKVSPSAKSDYQSYNTESWSQSVLGGDARKKSVYSTYLGIAKDNNITVYEAVKFSRSKFAGQFKNKFRSFSTFLSLPDVRNVTRTEINGKPAVIVHYTWRQCDSDDHCYTEHDEVTIPEINYQLRNDSWEAVQ